MPRERTNRVRNEFEIVGAIRENIERLKRRMTEPSFSVERLEQLIDELDEALIVRQMEASLKLVGAK